MPASARGRRWWTSSCPGQRRDLLLENTPLVVHVIEPTLQLLIVMIASAIDDRLQRKLDYVEEERRILKELDAATGGRKLSFSTQQRRRL